MKEVVKRYLRLVLKVYKNSSCGFYIILKVVIDDGTSMMLGEADYQKALTTLQTITSDLSADYAVVEERGRDTTNGKPQEIVAHLMIRKRMDSVEDLLEIRIAVVGNVVSDSPGCVVVVE